MSSLRDTYTCALCGETFIRGDVRCLVMHPLGCCHYGDKPLSTASDR